MSSSIQAPLRHATSSRLSTSSLGRPRSNLLSAIALALSASLHFTLSHAAPLIEREVPDAPRPPDDPQLWIYLGTALGLVFLGGAFAGLTIALMGQDEVYLQVIAQSGEGSERRNAVKVLNLLKKGKHWVLVTLLVGNVITNETLPIVLDRSIGGGYAAALSSTILVIVFGEIVPQSICVRFGLPIGAWMSPFVLLLMWLLAPVSWPVAKLLDYLLGENHGTTYKKAGLKTLVTLHKTMGESGADRLNEDEVSIISGVLDLKAKSVGSIMTPMNDVFVLSADAVLDEDMMDEIMREGYSRIPVHEPGNKNNFVGMLLVKMLITYDPEDARRVDDFSLATLPETLPDTSCLDIINFFQQGKSHMVLVSDYPGENFGALGVVTLEDVIEELIGEEIIDESDVFIDVHKAIRRLQPAPMNRFRARATHRDSIAEGIAKARESIDSRLIDVDGKDETRSEADASEVMPNRPSFSSDWSRSPPRTTFLVRQRHGSDSPGPEVRPGVHRRQYTSSEIRQQLKNLGPSNAARQPKATRVNAVKIKPGVAVKPIPEDSPLRNSVTVPRPGDITTSSQTAENGGIGQNSVGPGLEAKDGVLAVQRRPSTRERMSNSNDNTPKASVDATTNGNGRRNDEALDKDSVTRPRSDSHSTIGSMNGQRSPSNPSHRSRPTSQKRGTARSGSITENFVSSGGVKKLVLEATSSSEEGPSGEDSKAQSYLAVQSSQSSPEMSRQNSRSRVKPGEVVSGQRSDGKAGSSSFESNQGAEKKRKKKRGKRRVNSQSTTDGERDENKPLLNLDDH